MLLVSPPQTKYESSREVSCNASFREHQDRSGSASGPRRRGLLCGSAPPRLSAPFPQDLCVASARHGHSRFRASAGGRRGRPGRASIGDRQLSESLGDCSGQRRRRRTTAYPSPVVPSASIISYLSHPRTMKPAGALTSGLVAPLERPHPSPLPSPRGRGELSSFKRCSAGQRFEATWNYSPSGVQVSRRRLRSTRKRAAVSPSITR